MYHLGNDWDKPSLPLHPLELVEWHVIASGAGRGKSHIWVHIALEQDKWSSVHQRCCTLITRGNPRSRS